MQEIKYEEIIEKLLYQIYHEFLKHITNFEKPKNWHKLQILKQHTIANIIRVASEMHDWNTVHEWGMIYYQQKEWLYNRNIAQNILNSWRRYHYLYTVNHNLSNHANSENNPSFIHTMGIVSQKQTQTQNNNKYKNNKNTQMQVKTAQYHGQTLNFNLKFHDAWTQKHCYQYTHASPQQISNLLQSIWNSLTNQSQNMKNNKNKNKNKNKNNQSGVFEDTMDELTLAEFIKYIKNAFPYLPQYNETTQIVKQWVYKILQFKYTNGLCLYLKFIHFFFSI